MGAVDAFTVIIEACIVKNRWRKCTHHKRKGKWQGEWILHVMGTVFQRGYVSLVVISNSVSS